MAALGPWPFRPFKLVPGLFPAPSLPLHHPPACPFLQKCPLRSKYVDKEIKNALKEVKQIKTQIEQTNEERKLLLSSLEEAKEEERGKEEPSCPHLDPLCWRRGMGKPCQVAMVTLCLSFPAVSADIQG